MYYQVFKLKDQNSNRPLAIIQTVKSLLEVEQLDHFGLFPAYFGMATNELYWVVMREDLTNNLSTSLEQSGISVISVHNMVAHCQTNDPCRLLPEMDYLCFVGFQLTTKMSMRLLVCRKPHGRPSSQALTLKFRAYSQRQTETRNKAPCYF